MSYLMIDLIVILGNIVYYIWLGFFFKKVILYFINFLDCFNIIFILFCLKLLEILINGIVNGWYLSGIN